MAHSVWQLVRSCRHARMPPPAAREAGVSRLLVHAAAARARCGSRALSNLCLVLSVGSVEVLDGRAARRAPARAQPRIHQQYSALLSPRTTATRSVHIIPCRAGPSRWHWSSNASATSPARGLTGSRAREHARRARSSCIIHTRSPRIQPPSRSLRPASPATPAQDARPIPSAAHPEAPALRARAQEGGGAPGA